MDKKANIIRLLTGLMMPVLAAAPLYAAAEQENLNQEAKVPESRFETVPKILSTYRLSQLENSNSDEDLSLTGIQPETHLYFTVRQDEIIRAGSLKLNFTPSPALIPLRSQLNIFLNGSLQKTVAIQQEMIGRQSEITVDMNPLLIKNYNDLKLQFVGHYSDVCEDQLNTALWVNISHDSILELERQKLQIINDLAFLKEIFFHSTTKEQSVLSMVFAGTPDEDTVKAAAVIASWGGILADWRGIDYPVFIGQLPPAGNAVVFMTNTSRPDFLKDEPKTDHTVIEMRDLPGTSNGKMLLISSPDSGALVTAAKTITRGSSIMKGPKSQIVDFTESAPRKAYDAPKWVDISKETTLGELVQYDGQLISKGISPHPINLAVNLPPDLFFSEGSHVDLNLRHRYSNPPPQGISEMNLLFNNHLIRSYRLTPISETSTIAEKLPLQGFINIFNQSKIDALYLKHKNQMTFTYTYSHLKESKLTNCLSDVQPVIHQVEIDPNSTIDFSGLYHFTKMPNLGYYWQSGYPFTIYADLQQTTAIVESPESAAQLNVLFNAIGRMGSQTGYPAYNVRMMFHPDQQTLEKAAESELLIIGQIPEYIAKNTDDLLLDIDSDQQSFSYQGTFLQSGLHHS